MTMTMLLILTGSIIGAAVGAWIGDRLLRTALRRTIP